MTFEEAIKSNPTFVNVPDKIVDAAFISRAIEKTDDYTVAGLKEMELVSADLYLELATHPDYREGDLAVKANRDILMKRASNIYFKYDDPKYAEVGYSKVPLKVTKFK